MTDLNVYNDDKLSTNKDAESLHNALKEQHEDYRTKAESLHNALKEQHGDYRTKLATGIYEVSFTKVNGDKRIMTCTLSKNLLPVVIKEDALSTKKVRELNVEVVSVWDTTALGWRSFRVANVTNFKRISDNV